MALVLLQEAIAAGQEQGAQVGFQLGGTVRLISFKLSSGFIRRW
jgi:hypothetical protein